MEMAMTKKEKFCGRISQNPINSITSQHQTSKGFVKAYLVFLLGLATFSSASKSEAVPAKWGVELQKMPVNRPSEKMESLKTQNDYLRIKQRTVVSTEDNAPLPLVRVRIKGTHIETETDASGFFKLDVEKMMSPKSNLVLVFSCTGYITKEIELTPYAEHSIEIQLTPEIMWIGEVRIRWYYKLWWVLRSPFI